MPAADGMVRPGCWHDNRLAPPVKGSVIPLERSGLDFDNCDYSPPLRSLLMPMDPRNAGQPASAADSPRAPPAASASPTAATAAVPTHRMGDVPETLPNLRA